MEAHQDHVVAWWSEVMGGPPRHTQELGGYEAMFDHHRGLAATLEKRRERGIRALRAVDLPYLPWWFRGHVVVDSSGRRVGHRTRTLTLTARADQIEIQTGTLSRAAAGHAC